MVLVLGLGTGRCCPNCGASVRAGLRRSDTCVPVSLGGPSVAGHLLEGETSSSSLAGEVWGTPVVPVQRSPLHCPLRDGAFTSLPGTPKARVSQADSLLVAHTQLFAMDLEGGSRG